MTTEGEGTPILNEGQDQISDVGDEVDNDYEGIGVEESEYEDSFDESEFTLPSGEALSVSEAYPLTARAHAQLLVIAGPVGSGKTTLIASLLHRLQRGPFAGFNFAGSQTLIGFDRRSFLSRHTSRGDKPETPRTRIGESNNLLHLALRPCDMSSPCTDLLIADLSGEVFQAAVRSVDACRELGIIKRADRLVVVVDGGQISKPDQRQAAKREAEMLLRSCLDAGQLGHNSFVDIAISKWDLIEKIKDDTIDDFISSLNDSLVRKFASRLGELAFVKIAAHAHQGGYDIAFGVEGRLEKWVNESPCEIGEDKRLIVEPSYTSEFDNYLFRRLVAEN